jgi:hypothetical protein
MARLSAVITSATTKDNEKGNDMRLDKFTKFLNESETREWLKRPRKETDFQTASVWLADLLDEQEKVAGYQYNATFKEWFCKREGLPFNREEGDTLSCAIYNAQCYRHSRKLLNAGFNYLTTDMVKKAIELGKRIVIYTDSVFGSNEIEGRPIIQHNGEGFVLAPRSRKKGWGMNNLTIAKIAP